MANQRICSIPECGKRHFGKGFCSAHYTRLTRYGDPLKTKSTPKGDLQRYYKNYVLPYDGDECLIWPYGSSSGYGEMTKDGKEGYVHRFVCEDEYGPPPTPEHQAAHSCGNGHIGCVTKRHLSWKTPKENQADRLIHGTGGRGEKHSQAKLTEEQVIEIRGYKGAEPKCVIAKRYGVTPRTISDIHRGKRWGWLSP